MSEPKYYRLKVVEEYTDKTSGEVKERWNDVGIAFPMSKSGGFRVKLHLLDKDILMLPPKEGEDAPEIDGQEG